MPETVETVIVGAGVAGLAVTRPLDVSGQDVLMVDKAYEIGSHPRWHLLPNRQSKGDSECKWVLDVVAPITHPFLANSQFRTIG